MRLLSRFTLLVALKIVLSSVLIGEDLRVATFNVRNYLIMDRYIDGGWRPAYPKPEAEKEIIRQIIKEISPDILVLQEMGTPEFLEELRSDLALEGVEYEHAVHMQGADVDRHLAVLSNQAPLEVVKHTDLDFKYFEGRELVKRGMLEMTFGSGEDSFKLFAVHLKSRYTVNKEDKASSMRRVREAEACRDRIVDRTQELGLSDYLIAGDFNDHPVSSTLRRFYSRGDLEIAIRVPAFDSRGEVWTYYYEKEARYEAVDGFVASAGLLPRIKGGGAQIVDLTNALKGSDHRMVYLDLKR